MDRPIRGVASEIISNITDPSWVRGRIRHRVNGGFQTRIWPKRSGIDIPSTDWDVLVVFDACRADSFEEVIPLDDFNQYNRGTSRASQTKEWLQVNWPDTYGDVVYIAGNPMVSAYPPSVHRLEEVWRRAFDEQLGHIDAEVVTETAIDLLEEYRDKRFVIHYMQPHAPFIGHPELRFTEWELFDELDLSGRNDANDVWHACSKGLVEEQAVWEGYADNLEYVWQEAAPIIRQAADRRMVVTSDHGNIIRGRDFPVPITISGHPPDHRQQGLVTVPWGTIEAEGERPEIVSGKASSDSDANDKEVQDRLRALGYTS